MAAVSGCFGSPCTVAVARWAYGVPETFVIDGEGKVLLRHAGPLTRRVYDRDFAPILGPLN